MKNFFQAATVVKNSDAAKAKTPRQHGIIAVYKNGSFYAKTNNKLYLIENYKLDTGIVYSKPGNDAYPAWTRKEFTKELGSNLTFDNYLIIEKQWASLYDGQTITGVITLNNCFKLKSKTDKML